MGQLLQSQAQPTQLTEEEDPNPQAAWWCKLLARGVGTIGASIAIFTGIWTCISVHALCIGAGVLQVTFSLMVLMMESPCCFGWVEIGKPFVRFAEGRPFLQKAIAYGILAIIPVCMCFTLTTLFGSGLILAAGVLYGLMALGKKADRQDMLRRAGTGGEYGQEDMKSNLVDNEQQPMGGYK